MGLPETPSCPASPSVLRGFPLVQSDSFLPLPALPSRPSPCPGQPGVPPGFQERGEAVWPSPVVTWAGPSLSLGLCLAGVGRMTSETPLDARGTVAPHHLSDLVRWRDCRLPCLAVRRPWLWLLCVPRACHVVDATNTDCVLKYFSPVERFIGKLLTGWKRGKEGRGLLEGRGNGSDVVRI